MSPRSSRLRGKVASAIVLRGVALVGRAVVGILFARLLGASEVGVLFLAISVANLMALFARRGLDRMALSEISQRPGDAQTVVGQLTKRVGVSSIAATVLALVVLGTVSSLSDIRGGVFLWALLAIIPINISQVAAHALRAEERVSASLLTGALLAPPLRFAIFFVVGAQTADHASLAFLLGWTIVAALAIALSRPNFQTADGNIAEPASSRALHLDAVNTQLVDTLSIVAMSVVGVPADVGAFSVATRLERAALLPTIGTRFATAPRLASSDSEDRDRAMATAVRTARKAFAIQAPVAVLAFVLAPWFLELLGEGFERGTTWFRILLVASLVNAVTGSTTQILLVGKFRDELASSSRIALLAFAVATAALTPIFGPIGIVIAVSFAKVMRETVEWKVVKDKMGRRADVLSPVRS